MNIWDEKNYTEPQRNCSSNNEKEPSVTTQSTRNGSMKKECKGIGKKKIGPAFKTLEKFLEQATKKHGDKYDYSKVVYKGNLEKIEIVCKKHGSFWQLPWNHQGSGRGCPKCGGIKLGKLLASTTDNFIEKSKQVHGDRYDYSKTIYVRRCDRVIIVCGKHGEFKQVPQTHLHGSGCPKCTERISKPEKEFLNYCKIPENSRQKYVGKYVVDGIEGNTIYEFLGNYWHGNLRLFEANQVHPIIKKTYGEIYKNTFKKFDVLTSMGYEVKYIWEDEWENWKKRKFTGINEIKIYK